MSKEIARDEQAAAYLIDAHERKLPFGGLPPECAPPALKDAYEVQDFFVARKSDRCGAVAGWKIALTTPQMRAMVGLNDSMCGTILERQVLRSPGTVATADYGRLGVEFEIAVQLQEDLAVADAPFTREKVARAVGAVMPALELFDDRGADYAQLSKHLLALIADNAWNEGVVLGTPVRDWQSIDLAAVRGVARINGEQVGEGFGRDTMGHPFDALAWVANHHAARGHGLWRGGIVITGSLVTSKFVNPGDRVEFSLEKLGSVELQVT